MKSGYIKLIRNIMEERRFLVTYSFTVYNQGYSAFANDEIVLNKKHIRDERDIPFLLKHEIRKINRGNAYADKTLINFWEIR